MKDGLYLAYLLLSAAGWISLLAAGRRLVVRLVNSNKQLAASNERLAKSNQQLTEALREGPTSKRLPR